MSRIELHAGSLAAALSDAVEIVSVTSVAGWDAAVLRLESIEGGSGTRWLVAVPPSIDPRAFSSVAALGGRVRELASTVPSELHDSLCRVVFMVDAARTLEALRHEANVATRGP